MDKTSLGDRMKAYENIERRYLTARAPVIIRIDGVHFHSYTKSFERPFYEPFRQVMANTMLDLCKQVAGCKLGYTQSDEITLLVTDDDTLETQPWFGKNLQKIVSVGAAMATYYFNKNVENILKLNKDTLTSVKQLKNLSYLQFAHEKQIAVFDARAFCVPREEVLNAFEWRQQDCIRNAIESVGHTYFPQHQLQGKSCNEIKEMLSNYYGINFEAYPTWYKRGVCAKRMPKEIQTPEGEWITRNKWEFDYEIPIFHEDPNYIEDIVYHCKA